MRASNVPITNQERETGATGDSPMKLSYHQCSVVTKKANRMLVIIGKRIQKKRENIIKPLLKSNTFK